MAILVTFDISTEKEKKTKKYKKYKKSPRTQTDYVDILEMKIIPVSEKETKVEYTAVHFTEKNGFRLKECPCSFTYGGGNIWDEARAHIKELYAKSALSCEDC